MVFIIIFKETLKFILYRLNIKNFPSERTVKTNFNLQKKKLHRLKNLDTIHTIIVSIPPLIMLHYSLITGDELRVVSPGFSTM
jgi:hypothetical protein